MNVFFCDVYVVEGDNNIRLCNNYLVENNFLNGDFNLCVKFVKMQSILKWFWLYIGIVVEMKCSFCK